MGTDNPSKFQRWKTASSNDPCEIEGLIEWTVSLHLHEGPAGIKNDSSTLYNEPQLTPSHYLQG